MKFLFLLILPILLSAADRGALSGHRHRVLVSSDIGGTDPDDFQSMVHFLLYADSFDVEGIVSSPYGPGRLQHILQVIDLYQQDYPKLKTWSARYPAPATLRSISKQGAFDSPGPAGFGAATDGSNWIVQCARKPDPRPLYVLVWGGIEDLAQALHDAPDILPKLRVYFIGGPNKMWSVHAYNYIEQNHPKLWIVESNATYRGYFVGGDQSGDLGNSTFVSAYVAGRGALGSFFASLLKGAIKMGDTPSVNFLLKGDPENPAAPSWGGSYARIWDHRKTVFTRWTTEADHAEVFGVVEYAIAVPDGFTARHSVRVVVDNRINTPAALDGNTLRFRFSPRDAKAWSFAVKSDFPALDGIQGRFTAVPPPPEKTSLPSTIHPNWWIDSPDPALAEGVYPGAKSVNQWRAEFLKDFAARIARCAQPKSN
ncbi:MAG: DUF1593 domain-containing protein [Acidobacteria bacterium]|nr:DUF1593 domain-containing protein [Acidobacteriota bacterium]